MKGLLSWDLRKLLILFLRLVFEEVLKQRQLIISRREVRGGKRGFRGVLVEGWVLTDSIQFLAVFIVCIILCRPRFTIIAIDKIKIEILYFYWINF